ncbi:hypothetical protein [Streptomyces cellostaticus]|uniref:hypothetical protein n=1 Tax=Streptomyces cellostaticus TaxID=67285 RepID=UPI002025DEA5|nr:hypothetical protein [Streptomyces cellostaticus]
MAVHSTPRPFAAHRATDCAPTELRAADGRLPRVDPSGGVGVRASPLPLGRDIVRERPRPEDVGV